MTFATCLLTDLNNLLAYSESQSRKLQLHDYQIICENWTRESFKAKTKTPGATQSKAQNAGIVKNVEDTKKLGYLVPVIVAL